jgi:hypothetical protein
LYRSEDEDVVVKRARAAAEREWWERQGQGQGNNKERLERGVSGELERWQGGGKMKGAVRGWKWDVWLESLLESILE